MSERARVFGLALGTAASWRSAARADELSPYEQETVRLVLGEQKVDAAPAGKIIEAIEIHPLDVLEARDPLPLPLIDFLNFFHQTSQESVVAAQLLLRVGEPFDPERASETARNLRRIRQLSLVLVTTSAGSDPDHVRVHVITKDIWSLRLNSDFRVANDELEYLLIAPSEENLGGLHHSASLRFELEPDTYKFGGSYRVPRLGRSFVQGSLSAVVILNRDTGAYEGTQGAFSYGQPLYSTDAAGSWLASVAWLSETTRFFRGTTPLTFDAVATPEDDAIPIQYSTDTLAGRISFTRSLGDENKFDLHAGAEVIRTAYRPIIASSVAATAREEFARAEVPISEKRLYPYVGLSAYSTDFRRLIDVDTLGLQEDYRMFHDAFLKVYPVVSELGSTRSFLGASAGASFTLPLGDGLVRGLGQTLFEASTERVYDFGLTLGLFAVSPRTGFGRFFSDLLYQERFENYLRRRTSVGGDNRLRGYPSGAYRTDDVLQYSTEFRTRPAELWTVQLGGAAFWDLAAVWGDGAPLAVRQDVGTGLRVVFPQLERTVIRFDWAVPLVADPSVGVTAPLPGRFLFTFEQAFAPKSVAMPFVTP